MMTDSGLIIPRPVNGDAALAATLEWLCAPESMGEFGALVLQPLDASGAPNTLAKRLAAAGLTDWRDTIVAAASPGQPLHLDPRLAWLMSQAALEIAADAEHPGLFRLVEQLQILGNVTDIALASAICDRVANTSKDYPLLKRLRTHLQMLWNSRFNDRWRQYAEANATRLLRSRDLWPRHGGIPIGDGWAHRAVATLCPDRYMEMLASFPAVFQHEFDASLSPLDMDLAASLVRASPDVFSSNGVPLGPVFVFVLLDAVETRFATIDVQDAAADENGLNNVLNSVFSRRDGDWIGRAWLQQIIWRDTPRRAGRAQADVDAQRTLRNSLVVQLSSRLTPLGNAALSWVRQEEPLWGVHRVLSEASILEAHGDAVAAAAILAEAVLQGLVSATGRPAGLTTGSPESTIITRVLANLPDRKQWFETLWRDTYELREHLSYLAYCNLDNPAYPALTWSLIGLNSSQATPNDTAEFWRMIGAAVFETQRTDTNARLFNGAMPPITRVTVQLGAALVEHGTLPLDDFAHFMADQLEPTAEHARLWQITRSEASDAVTLAVGRLVGAPLLRQALEAGLAQHLPGWDAVFDRSAWNDLTDFSSRL